MAVELKDALASWMNCGTIGVAENVVAETTVDATFRIVEAVNQSIGLVNTTADLAPGVKSLTIQDAGNYAINMYTRFEGSNKEFEFSVFVNGIESAIKIKDKFSGSTAVAPTVPLPAGAVLDLRQRSVDGGTALLVHYCGISINRLT